MHVKNKSHGKLTLAQQSGRWGSERLQEYLPKEAGAVLPSRALPTKLHALGPAYSRKYSDWIFNVKPAD